MAVSMVWPEFGFVSKLIHVWTSGRVILFQARLTEVLLSVGHDYAGGMEGGVNPKLLP